MLRKNVTNFRGEYITTPSNNIYIKDEPRTPVEDFGDYNYLDQSFENHYGSMRKSLSMNDIAALRDDLVNMEYSDRDVYERHRKPFNAPQELSRTKFVSMAEAVYHYQRDTPGRFHSSKPQLFKSQRTSSRPELTVPQSPMLRSKTRARPVHIMSQKEKEELELEEIKKFQIKAHPIPKSVIEGPKHLPEVNKKPITIPEPFNLTELHKKIDLIQSPNTQKFKARPAPKHILEKPQIPVKLPAHVHKPKSLRSNNQLANLTDQLQSHNKQNLHPVNTAQKSIEKNKEKSQRNGPLRPEPFSFEKRDEGIKRRKEEWIKRQIEEEKKQACLFKAQPLPGVVRKQMQRTAGKGSSSTASSENKENHVKFEARPPAVLYKEPFKPVLQPMQYVRLMPFELTTEKRAAEREKFDQLLKLKEEEQERLRQQREKELQEAEEKNKSELRSKLVHHAKPAPVLAPFVPEKSVMPVTVPETPKFVRKLKQNLKL